MTATVHPETTAATPQGLAPAPRVTTYGTPDFYSERYAGMRSTFLELPTAQEGLAQLRAKVQGERRQDYRVTAAEVRMLANGTLSTPLGVIRLEPRGAARLYSAAVPGGAAYLARCPWLDLVAQNVNRHLQETIEAAEVAEEPLPALCTLRTRVGEDGGRQVFAVVGSGYGAIDADRVALEAAGLAFPGSRADIKTDGYRTRIDLVNCADVDSGEVGQPFKAGLRLTTADDGTEALRVQAFVIRPKCRNMAILAESLEGDRKSIAHRGRKVAATGDVSVAHLAERLRGAIEAAKGVVAGFAEQWARAEAEKVMESGADPRKVFATLSERGLVAFEGCTRDEGTNRLVQAWQREPGYTKRAIINAITRAAHTNRWGTWGAEALEEQAGKLLHVKLSLN